MCVYRPEWEPRLRDGGSNKEEDGDREDNDGSRGKDEREDLEVNESLRSFTISSKAARASLALSPAQSILATSPIDPSNF